MDTALHIRGIRSGGQTGVDRGALDAARAAGVPTCGWCPKGGWAEDHPEPPGLLADYPELQETPLEDVMQRTEWNVLDADATLVIDPEGASPSPGTKATMEFARTHRKGLLVVTGASKRDMDRIKKWLEGLGECRELNVAGPRESEFPGAYDLAYRIVQSLLSK